MSMTETLGSEATNNGTQYIVRYAGYPVRFNHNAVGFVYELVAEDRATVFADEIKAATKAVKHDLRNFTITPL